MAQSKQQLRMRRVKEADGKVCSICGKAIWGVIPPHRQSSVDSDYLIHGWCHEESVIERNQSAMVAARQEQITDSRYSWCKVS